MLRGLPEGETLKVVFERQDVYRSWPTWRSVGLRQFRIRNCFLPDGRHKLVGLGLGGKERNAAHRSCRLFCLCSIAKLPRSEIQKSAAVLSNTAEGWRGLRSAAGSGNGEAD